MILSPTLSARGILFPADAGAADRSRVGGKAAGLARLRDAGCDVPDWFVVTPACCDDHVVLDALARLVAEEGVDSAPDTTFAVRSSALVEDGSNASYAGQFASRLFVPRDDVLDAIAQVRASASSDGARAYAGGADLAPIAVVVQRMIDGQAGGVAFGVDPVDGSDVVVVTAAYGLTAGIVDGDLVVDTWRVERDGTIGARTLAEKDRMHVRAPGAGTLAVAVEPALRARPVLGDDAVTAVASLVRRIANASGAPQDVEFTLRGGRLWALQARPVTAIGSTAAPVARAKFQINRLAASSRIRTFRSIISACKSPAIKSVFKATSATSGGYALKELPAGTYNVTVSIPALKAFSRNGLKVDATQTVALDIHVEETSQLSTLGEDWDPQPRPVGVPSHWFAGSMSPGTAGFRAPANRFDARLMR